MQVMFGATFERKNYYRQAINSQPFERNIMSSALYFYKRSARELFCVQTLVLFDYFLLLGETDKGVLLFVVVLRRVAVNIYYEAIRGCDSITRQQRLELILTTACWITLAIVHFGKR